MSLMRTCVLCGGSFDSENPVSRSAYCASCRTITKLRQAWTCLSDLPEVAAETDLGSDTRQEIYNLRTKLQNLLEDLDLLEECEDETKPLEWAQGRWKGAPLEGGNAAEIDV